VSIGPTTPSTFRLDDVFSAAGVDRRIRVETPLSGIACGLVAAGVGVSVVDPFTASEYATRGVVACRFEPAIDFQIAALYPAGRTLSPIAREYVDGFARHIERFRKGFRSAA
jgi:DNA-binding transcriptional LysR family regulator